ncbi:MAG: twin-arginine translocation signal domain-containing protein [Planctomycetes bacterium]|nr:twin-arginine translocation signal domain-containing protein [Planctomycetota bacterium]
MTRSKGTRRDFLKAVGLGAAALGVPAAGNRAVAAEPRRGPAKGQLSVNPQPKYGLSPYLYQQFMEPLGTTDGSVSAAWDYANDRWRPDVIDVTKRLAPPLLRWGGLFMAHYRWREGVGPREQRKPVYNMSWGGMETNQVGTAEFVDFCRQTAAEPLMCVNFESDGKPYFMRGPKGDVRTADAKEAAEWVRYCNNPDNEERIGHGHREPLTIRMWQLGNETSYAPEWDVETCGRKTIEFAKAMRQEDPSIELIGWGDSGWGPRILEMAGEHLQYIAFHHMFNPARGHPDNPLRGIEYRKDPDRTWAALMDAVKMHEERVRRVYEEMKDYDTPLALTECHFALPGRNRCEVLSSWAAGVADARLANMHERYGDKLKIATLADFCGTRWQVNAIMIPVPGGKSFMMPVARIMCLYRHHSGEQAIDVTNGPDELDVTAGITADRVYLHVVNTQRTQSVEAALQVDGRTIQGGRVFTLAADPEFEVFEHRNDILEPVEKPLSADGKWTFPAASVSAVELDLEKIT